MQHDDRLIAIYDFEFFPYALGDVLTWNIRTAMRCEELGKKVADLYICLDERYPASIYQRGLVNPDNFDLFFSELYGAFGTNPRLGNIHIFRNREAMLEQLRLVTRCDDSNLAVLDDYLKVMKHRSNPSLASKGLSVLSSVNRIKSLIKKSANRLKHVLPKKLYDGLMSYFSQEYALNLYFINYVYSHEAINAFYDKYQSIPFLKPSLGCVPDVEEIIARKFKGKILVPFHLRLRRLDVGYGGDHSYARDSNFLEWYHFLREASRKHPDVQFIALGRLQEKPLELLRLPNVDSLRVYGMGLGHELTFMLKSHFFIGSSSGFAALANFSELPYFITRMNIGSCKAYAIAEGATKLPFAAPNQKLIYEEEKAVLLMKLLEEGLNLVEIPEKAAVVTANSQHPLDIKAWLKEHAKPYHYARTTCRFYQDEAYRQEETAYLLLPYLEEARKLFLDNDFQAANEVLHLLNQNFPELCEKLPFYLLLQSGLAAQIRNASLLQSCLDKLRTLSLPDSLNFLFSQLEESTLFDQLRRGLEELNFAEVAL